VARRHPILRGLAILVAVGAGVLVAVTALVAVFSGDLGERLSFGRSVAVLDVHGVMTDASDTIEALDRFRRHDSTVAVVLRIDSPGGAVAPAQELYDAVWRLRNEKPVVASLGNVAASAAYYVASAATVIVADPGTMTGSIGAIMTLPLYAPLAEKLGVSEQVVKSGPYKDIGHPLRPLSAEERALLQGMVDDVLGQFVAAVARGRQMDAAKVRAIADGRVLSGAQAQAAGLVDQLGGLDEATHLAWTRAGQEGEPRVSRVRLRRRAWWLDLLGELLLSQESPLDGGLLFLYRGGVPQ
jgi:protease IV